MASSPYQSNLLRFFVGQYQQGLNRHRKAVRQTRSTIALGGELGGAVALFPVYAAVRAARSVGKSLKQSVDKFRLLAVKTSAAELLDFTDFDQAVSGSILLDEALSLLGDDAAIKAFDQPDTLVSEGLRAEAAMAKMLVAVGNGLFSRQIQALSRGPSWLRSPWRSSQRLVHGVVSRFTKSTSELTQARSVKVAETKKEKITGVACDLETRSLVLILGHAVVWDGLTLAQQGRLQDQIALLVDHLGDGGDAMPLPAMSSPAMSIAVKPLPMVRSLRRQSTRTISRIQTKLVRPIQSFWVAVLQLIDELTQRSRPVPKPLRTGSQRLPGSSSRVQLLALTLLTLPVFQPSAALKSVTSIVQPSADRLVTIGQMGPGKNYLEADVISIDYIEHPLEKLLKWVDKIFLWIERRWQIFLDWLSRK